MILGTCPYCFDVLGRHRSWCDPEEVAKFDPEYDPKQAYWDSLEYTNRGFL